MAKLVRLKPYDPKKGYVIRRYTAFSIRFARDAVANSMRLA